ncbi:NB-ARC domain-containing protein [Amycolatopsis sp. cg5]|uniref:ATP-binding protein n=1 Tax=Amycolatopsis sp. cg5 TaxID=3238802 RepID=UPI00352561D4
MTLDSLLRDHRCRVDLTQEALSERSGVSVRAINYLERGVTKSPQRRTIDLLADALGLTGEQSLELRKAAKRARPQPATVRHVPAGVYEPLTLAMLPPDLDDLTGRVRDLGALCDLADELKRTGRRSGRCAVLSGPPGTGKTSLVVRAAHDLAAAFPDGTFFLKLRGVSAQPSDPAEVLHLLLRALGVNAVHIPAELEDRVSLCRSLLRDRAALLVFDDAADEAQVRPLLVGGLRCLTLVTSRQLLVGIEAAHRLDLGVLGHGDAVELLSAITGQARVAREPSAASELVELCGRLPLAIRIAGNRLASRPGWPLTHLVGMLRDRGRRLTALTAGDLDVRGVFDLSYRQLTPAAATAFRRLSLVPAADFSAGAAMALLDAQAEHEAAALVDELADASLLQTAPRQGRYQFHDLLRVFAAERLAQEETSEDIAAADDRLACWLMRTAMAAVRYFRPTDGVSAPPVAGPWFDDHLGAGRWLETEAQNWLAAAKSCAVRGDHQRVLDLAKPMHWYSELGGTASTWELLELAVRSAVAVGSKLEEGVHRNYLGWVHNSRLGGGPSPEYVDLARQACAAAMASGDLIAQAWAHTLLANAHRANGDSPAFRDAMETAIRLFEQAGHRLGVHLARFMRADHAQESGMLEEAAAEFEICVRYFRQPYGGPRNPSDDINYANILLNASHNLAALKLLDQALDHCEEALELFERHGATMGRARALQSSGRYLRRRCEHRNARAKLTEALALFERAGLPRCQVETLCDLASLSDELGEPSIARAERERALSLCDNLGAPEAAELRAKLAQRLAE